MITTNQCSTIAFPPLLLLKGPGAGQRRPSCQEADRVRRPAGRVPDRQLPSHHARIAGTDTGTDKIMRVHKSYLNVFWSMVLSHYFDTMQVLISSVFLHDKYHQQHEQGVN